MKFNSYIKCFCWAIVASFFLTSCGDMTEEITLHKDGSGTVDYTMDLTKSIEMIGMLGAMSGDSTAANFNPDDLWAELGSETIDTSFDFKQSLPPESISKLDNPSHLEKFKLGMKGDKRTKSLSFNIHIDFDSFEEVDAIFETLQQASQDADEQSKMVGEAATMFAGTGMGETYSFSKKSFQRNAVEKAEMGLGDMMGEMGGGEGQEMKAMMDMFLSGNSFTSIYHFPYKVKQVDHSDANIHENKVTIERDFADYIEEGHAENFTIKFKKKFLGIFD